MLTRDIHPKTLADFSRTLAMALPRRLIFGPGCIGACVRHLAATPARRLLITSKPIRPLSQPILDGVADTTLVEIPDTEPTFATVREVTARANSLGVTGVIGVGGGSVLDVAKVVAALLKNDQSLDDIVGTDQLRARNAELICLPTTSGTGSEVSPNSILIDDRDHTKKAVISPHLLPDATFIDPALTLGCPPGVTAASGIDALVHAIEAYANKLAHPLIDPIALEAIRLIGANVIRAVEDGSDLAARSAMALGSLYAGMCLGPVNTGAVHALAYPLGTMFNVAHGLSNAMLLPHVLQFNLPAAVDRYAAVARALGVEPSADDHTTATAGVEHLFELVRRCRIPQRLRDVGVTKDSIPAMADQALTIRRLLDRNVRELSRDDAIGIYSEAF